LFIYKYILSTLAILFFIGCGYKPTSYYTKKSISDKVYVSLAINIANPQNSLFIKDSLNEILISRFKSSLVELPKDATTTIDINLKSITLTTLQYDESGYSSLYKASVSIGLSYNNKITKRSGSFTLNGEYTFAIDSNSVISNNKQIEAIKIASSNALEELLSKFAIITVQDQVAKEKKLQSLKIDINSTDSNSTDSNSTIPDINSTKVSNI
jgi:hypothetical protein